MRHMGMVGGYAYPVTQRIVDAGEGAPAGTYVPAKPRAKDKLRRCAVCDRAILDSRKTTYCSPPCARVGKARRVAALREGAAHGGRGAA